MHSVTQAEEIGSWMSGSLCTWICRLQLVLVHSLYQIYLVSITWDFLCFCDVFLREARGFIGAEAVIVMLREERGVLAYYWPASALMRGLFAGSAKRQANRLRQTFICFFMRRRMVASVGDGV